jgi:2'-5' RNA ligase
MRLRISPQNNEPLTRAFVRVALPEDVSEEAGRFIGKLGKFSGFKWVGRGQLHITLKFLGDMTPGQILSLDTNLSRIGGLRPFEVILSGAGAFPDMAKASVLWLGVSGGGEHLSKLASSVDRAAAASGCGAEHREFHPHLTIARARGGRVPGGMPGELAEALAAAPTLSWVCASFTLMRSVLSVSGAAYTPLGDYPLA